MAKRKQPKTKPRHAARPLVLNYQIRRSLDEADSYIEDEDLEAALQVLEPLRSRAPANVEVLERLAYVYFNTKQWPQYVEVAEWMLQLTPTRSDNYLALFTAYLRGSMPFCAAHTLRTFLARFPEHPEAVRVQKDLDHLQQTCSRLMARMRTEDEFPLDGEAGARVLRSTEWSQVLLDVGRLDEAQELLRQLAQQAADWPLLLKNRSLALGILGHPEEGLALLERVLAHDPSDLFALTACVKQLFFLGRADAARALIIEARGRAQNRPRDDVEVKLAEVLGLLGDDEGVLAMCRQAAAANRPKEPALHSILLFLAGTAELRLGNQEAARLRWEESLAADPEGAHAQASLADLDLPPSRRHAPFYLDCANLFPLSWTQEVLGQLCLTPHDAGARARARRYLAERPTLIHVLPALLDRGDKTARTLALALCEEAATPETLVALRDFALGQRGPDQLRVDALPVLVEAGILPPGPSLMWVDGQWAEIVTRTVRVSDEPSYRHSPHELRRPSIP